MIDPVEAIDALLAELHRQKAAGVLRVSVSDESLQALKALAGAPASAVSGRAVQAAPAASNFVTPKAPASVPRPIVVTPASAKVPAAVPTPAVAAPVARPLPAPPVLTLPPGTKAERLAWVHARISDCAVTREHLQEKHKPVLGYGSPEAKVMFVGEAPTLEEVEAGRVFVGASGELLRKILAAAGLGESDVYLTALMAWRPEPPTPYGKRPPNAGEIAFNLPYLRAQIDAIQPAVVVALGAQAFEAMVQAKRTITQERGTWHEFEGRPLMPTLHPSYLLHNSSLSAKRAVWEDFLKILERIGVEPTAKQRGYFLAPPRPTSDATGG